MKITQLFLSAVLLLAGSVSFGATLLCQGPVIISSVFFPGPMTRTATLLIAAEQGDLKNGLVTVSIGGDPLEYKGPLFLDGRQAHVIKNKVGEQTEFFLTLQGSQQVILQLRMTSADQQSPILSTNPALLTCQSQNN